MSLFTTRVKLHKANSAEDYKTLHEEMAKEGFWQIIKLQGESVSYHLPTAEYNYSSEKFNTEEVMNLAIKTANRTNKKFSVLVTKADGRRYWHNLEKV